MTFWSKTPVRFSHLRAYGRSPAHGKHARLAAKDDPSIAMERGTAVHAILFNTKKVIAYPGATRRGKEYDAFAAANQGAHILTGAEYDKSNRMVDAIRACKIAQPFLSGIYEETLLFRWLGMECRATPDVRGPDYVTELKTSVSSDPAKFVWHARRMHYHAQLKFQEYACEAKRIPIRDHWIVCVEATEPHPVQVFHVEPEAMEEAEQLLTLWGERLKNCEASDAFPPYSECITPIVWPKDIEFEYEEAA